MSLFVSGRRKGGKGGQEPAPAPHSDELPAWAREVVVYGCHGGAGTSTIKELLEAAWDLGSYTEGRVEISTYGRPLALVARDNVSASAQATEVLGALTSSGVRVAALVVVADGSGPEPSEATMRFRLAQAQAGSLIRFPFVSGLRYVDSGQVRKVNLPKKAQGALSDIRTACRSAALETIRSSRDEYGGVS